MFWNKKVESSSLGVPLDDLIVALQGTTLKASRKGDSLIVEHESFTTHVDVIRPANRESENGPIMAVVQVRSVPRRGGAALLLNPARMAVGNSMATLGALTANGKEVFVGSRLTMYEGEEAWNIQFPLLLFSVIGSTDSLFGGMRRSLTGQDGENSASVWREQDFEQIESCLSKLCVCTGSGDGLIAEFGLRKEAISAATGDHATALWQLQAGEPHPEMGGGLFCLLQLPHQVSDESRLDGILSRLNQMEMAPHDLPPHFGAWCRGSVGNPAYVSFLPNALHSIAGIAVNMSAWARARAMWADAMLASFGIRA